MAVGKNKPKKPRKLDPLDELFLKVLNNYIFTVTSHFERYEYSRAKSKVDEFFWKMFCDNYLEIVKKRIYQGKGNEKLSAQYALYYSLLAILKMISPIMPFITEEIYQTYYQKHEKTKSIHLCGWPKYDKKLEGWIRKTKSHANELTLFIDLLTKIRTEKTKAQKPMSAECKLTISEMHYEDLKDVLEDFKNVTNAKEIKVGREFKVEFV